MAVLSYCQGVQYTYLWHKELARSEFRSIVSVGGAQLCIASVHGVVRGAKSQRELEQE